MRQNPALRPSLDIIPHVRVQAGFFIVELFSQKRATGGVLRRGSLGFIHVGATTPPCTAGKLKTLQVHLASAEPGWGPLLYDFAALAAWEAHGRVLVSDREAVSDAALAVWEYYKNDRPDVKKHKLACKKPRQAPESYIPTWGISIDANTFSAYWRTDAKAWLDNTKYKWYMSRGTAAKGNSGGRESGRWRGRRQDIERDPTGLRIQDCQRYVGTTGMLGGLVWFKPATGPARFKLGRIYTLPGGAPFGIIHRSRKSRKLAVRRMSEVHILTLAEIIAYDLPTPEEPEEGV